MNGMTAPTPSPASRPLVREKLKHEQVRAQLLSEIANGNLRPGDALPTEHQLAEAMSVSRTTIRQTLGDMEREGLIHRVRGKGTYLSERVAEDSAPRIAAFAAIVPELANSYYTTLLQGFSEASHEVGQAVLICNSNNDLNKQASHILRLTDQRVAGVLLNPCPKMTTPAYHVRALQNADIPVVLLHWPVPESSAPLLMLPYQEIGCRLGELVGEAGHRRVAFLTSHRGEGSIRFRAGLEEGLQRFHLELDDELVDWGQMESFTPDDYQKFEIFVEKTLQRMLSLAPPPTAMVVTNDLMAEMVYLILQRRGLRVPEDISLVGFGGARREGSITRRLTAIAVDETAAARMVVKLLVEMRDGKRSIQDNEQFMLPPQIIAGQSLKVLTK